MMSFDYQNQSYNDAGINMNESSEPIMSASPDQCTSSQLSQSADKNSPHLLFDELPPSTVRSCSDEPQTPLQGSTGGLKRGSSGGGKGYNVQITEPPVTESRGFDSVKSEEKRGMLYNAIPSMPLPVAVLCCVLNIVIPGSGTLVSSFMVFCCGTTTRCESKAKAFSLNLLAALLQFVTFIVIVGWVWSISWGMTFVQLALSVKDEVCRAAIPYYVRRHSSVG